MNMRDRIIAVARGLDHDRVPFAQYDNNAAPNEEIWSVIGRENMGILRWSRAYQFHHPHCEMEYIAIRQDGLDGFRVVLHTPKGDLEEIRLQEPGYKSWGIREHFVKDISDYELLLAYFRDVEAVDNSAKFYEDQAELGEDGTPHFAVERTPFQQLWVQWVCIEDLCIHLYDSPDIVYACMSEMTRIQRDIYKIIGHLDPPYVVFPDNITAEVIGERYFKEFCVPAYRELVDLMDEKDIPVFVHMDGNLKPIWDAITESGIRGMDSFSPPPDNDTSVAEALELWPEMRVCLNFPSSLHLARADVVYENAKQILLEGSGSGRVQIQISENVPAGAWKTSYPEIVRAINDYGRV